MKEMSIHVSNISHIDPVSGKATRTKIVVNNGVKSIVSKSSNQVIRVIVDKSEGEKLGENEKV